MSNIAIIVDSGTDVPQDIIEKYGMYYMPLTIQYEEKSYKDRVDISTDEILARLETEIPTTSLPSLETTLATLQGIYDKGIRQVIMVTISSGLSGTFNMFRLAAEEMTDMEIALIDTKNISVGAGITAIRAAELVDSGMGFADVVEELNKNIKNTSVFFTVATLKYLQKGGRIGLVSAVVGTLLGIKPIISCNEEGIYYTVKKVRGANAAVEGMIEILEKLAKGKKQFNVLVAHTGAEEKAKEIKKALKRRIPTVKNINVIGAGPAMAVHTGPELLGMAIQIL